MTFIMCDGCDSYTGVADFEQKGWVVERASGALESSIFFRSTAGAFGGGCIGTNAFDTGFARQVSYGFPKTGITDSFYLGFWFNPFGGLSTNRNFVSIGMDGAWDSGLQYSFALETNPSDGSIEAYRAGSISVGSSATGVLATDTWSYILIRLIARNSPNGEYQVWVDDQEIFSATGVDTVASQSNEGVNFFGFAGGNAVEYRFDDIIAYNSAAGDNFNAKVKPLRIDTIRPDGAGSASTSTVTGAASNWQAVNGTDPDGTSVYTSFNATGQDLFTMDDVPTTASRDGTPELTYGVVVNGVQGRDTSLTSQTIRPLVRSGATTGTGTTQATGLAFNGTELQARQELFHQDPNTADVWEYADLNNIELGWERVA
jgi:hypothetical protein